MARSYLLFLEDMQLAMERIGRYCVGLDFEALCHNELVVDEIVRNPEVIGHAAKIPLVLWYFSKYLIDNLDDWRRVKNKYRKY